MSPQFGSSEGALGHVSGADVTDGAGDLPPSQVFGLSALRILVGLLSDFAFICLSVLAEDSHDSGFLSLVLSALPQFGSSGTALAHGAGVDGDGGAGDLAPSQVLGDLSTSQVFGFSPHFGSGCSQSGLLSPHFGVAGGFGG